VSLHHPIPTIGAGRAGRAIAYLHRLLDGGQSPGRLRTFVLPSVAEAGDHRISAMRYHPVGFDSYRVERARDARDLD
jgi:hypothetical protein